MGGEASNDLAGVLLGFGLHQAEQRVKQEAVQKKTQADINLTIATDLATRGMFDSASSDLIKSIEKTAGKDALPGLFDLNRANQDVARFRRGALDLTEAPVEESVTRQGLLFPTVERVPQAGTPAALFQQGLGTPDPSQQSTTAPVTTTTDRPPTDIERFRRFEALSPTGAQLVAGGNFGVLRAAELKAFSQTNLKRLDVRGAFQKAVIKATIEQGREVRNAGPAVDFNPQTVPRGFIAQAFEGNTFLIQTPNEEFNYATDFDRVAREFVDDKREITPLIAQKINARLVEESGVKALAAGTAKRINYGLNTLNQNFKGQQRYYDTTTGEKVPGGVTQNVVDGWEKQKAAKFLSTEQQKNLENLKQSTSTYNLLIRHLRGVYGPGGIYGRMRDSGRFNAGARGAWARFFQTDPELAVASRTLKQLVGRLNREFGGQRGVETEKDTARALAGLATLDGIPDRPEVAFGLMKNIYDVINGSTGKILSNNNFKYDNATVELATPTGGIAQLADPAEVANADSGQFLDPIEIETFSTIIGLNADDTAALVERAQAGGLTATQAQNIARDRLEQYKQTLGPEPVVGPGVANPEVDQGLRDAFSDQGLPSAANLERASNALLGQPPSPAPPAPPGTNSESISLDSLGLFLQQLMQQQQQPTVR